MVLLLNFSKLITIFRFCLSSVTIIIFSNAMTEPDTPEHILHSVSPFTRIRNPYKDLILQTPHEQNVSTRLHLRLNKIWKIIVDETIQSNLYSEADFLSDFGSLEIDSYSGAEDKDNMNRKLPNFESAAKNLRMLETFLNSEIVRSKLTTSSDSQITCDKPITLTPESVGENLQILFNQVLTVADLDKTIKKKWDQLTSKAIKNLKTESDPRSVEVELSRDSRREAFLSSSRVASQTALTSDKAAPADPSIKRFENLADMVSRSIEDQTAFSSAWVTVCEDLLTDLAMFHELIPLSFDLEPEIASKTDIAAEVANRPVRSLDEKESQAALDTVSEKSESTDAGDSSSVINSLPSHSGATSPIITKRRPREEEIGDSSADLKEGTDTEEEGADYEDRINDLRAMLEWEFMNK